MRSITRLTVAIIATLIAGGAAACFSEHVATDATGIDIRALCSGSSTVPANIVIIRNFSFNPSTVTIRSGEQVTWVNCEDTPGLGHTSTSDGGVWRSGLIVPLVSYSRTFNQGGSFPYHCEPHPSMKATVVVQ